VSLLILARHAQALPQAYVGIDHPVSDAGLSALGRRQAQALGKSLLRRRIRPDLVVTGGLERQRETAEVCLRVMASGSGQGGPASGIEVDRRWQEYDVGGILAAYPPDSEPAHATLDPRGFQGSLDQSLQQWMDDLDPPPALQSWSAFTAGVLAALSAAASRSGKGSTGLVVTSGGPISVVAAHLLGLGPQGLLGLHRVLVNGSITKVISGSRGLHLVTFNEHGHLEIGDRALVSYR
jgi:broad specificity phosphatase PhoE